MTGDGSWRHTTTLAHESVAVFNERLKLPHGRQCEIFCRRPSALNSESLQVRVEYHNVTHMHAGSKMVT
jgi:hypothetical protein